MMKRELLELITENNITEFCDFMDYLLKEGLFKKHSYASNDAYFFDKYISSRRRKQKGLMRQDDDDLPNVEPKAGKVLQ